MTPREHYEAAEKLIARAMETRAPDRAQRAAGICEEQFVVTYGRGDLIAAAQVHATLARVAPSTQANAERVLVGHRQNKRPLVFADNKVSIVEAAEYLGVSTKTIRRYVESGKLPAQRAGSRIIRVNLSDLDGLLSSMEGPA